MISLQDNLYSTHISPQYNNSKLGDQFPTKEFTTEKTLYFSLQNYYIHL